MSSNYPEGSMRGSGIYEQEVTLSVDCPFCNAVFDDVFTTDDWGNIDVDVTCLVCSHDFNVSFDDESKPQQTNNREES